MRSKGVCAGPSTIRDSAGPLPSGSMPTEHDVGALCRTYLAYLRLSAETVEGTDFRAVRQDRTPLIYMVNHLQVDPGVTVDVDAFFSFMETHLGHLDHRFVVTVPFVDPVLQARLVEADFLVEPTWQGLLKGPLLGPAPRECDIRPVVTEVDWGHLDRLVRADHVETDERTGRSIFTPEVTAQMQAARRICRDEVHFFLAWDGEEPVAFFSSWQGVDGVGMVEDLFTLPSHRGQGYARALIHHCVDDARARGAEQVLIGAYTDDTPKNAYVAMGFESTCLTWEWLRVPKD